MKNEVPKIERRKYTSVSNMMVYKNLPFLSVLCLLGLVYIANVHIAEKNMQKSQKLLEELRELKSEYWPLKSSILSNSTEVQISKKVSDQQLYLRTDAPKKLIRKEN